MAHAVEPLARAEEIGGEIAENGEAGDETLFHVAAVVGEAPGVAVVGDLDGVGGADAREPLHDDFLDIEIEEEGGFDGRERRAGRDRGGNAEDRGDAAGVEHAHGKRLFAGAAGCVGAADADREHGAGDAGER